MHNASLDSTSLFLIGLLTFRPTLSAWTLTQYFEEHKSTREPSTYIYGGTSTAVVSGATLTSLSSVIPTVTDPVAITTIIKTDETWALSYHQVVIPSGQAVTVDPSAWLTESLTHYRYYVARITTGFTGSCALPTQTVTKWFGVPDPLSGHLSAIDTTTSLTLVDSTAYSPPRTSVFLRVQLNITELPFESQESVNNELGWEPIRPCHPRDVIDTGDDNFNSTGPDDSNSTSRDDSPTCHYIEYGFGSGYKCESGWVHSRGLRVDAAVAAFIVLWAGFIAIIGILQSILRFRNLMAGRQARSGVPPAFALMLPPISLLVLCVPRAHYAARSAEDKAIMRKQWQAGSVLAKIRLWGRYALSCGYPAVLGPAPPRIHHRSSTTLQAAQPGPGNVRNEQHPEEPPPPPYSPPASPTQGSAAPPPDVSVAPLPEVLHGEQPPKYES